MIMFAGSDVFRICLYMDHSVLDLILFANCIRCGLVYISMSTGLWSELRAFSTCRCSILNAGLVMYISSASDMVHCMEN